MIAKTFRLRRWRVQKILKREESKKIGKFIVKMLPNKVRFHRFSLVLSRKFAKKAVDRNKKKRQIYESIRENLKHFKEKELETYQDVVLIPYKHILTSTFSEIELNINDIITYLYK